MKTLIARFLKWLDQLNIDCKLGYHTIQPDGLMVHEDGSSTMREKCKKCGKISYWP